MVNKERIGSLLCFPSIAILGVPQPFLLMFYREEFISLYPFLILFFAVMLAICALKALKILRKDN
jgi:hypothetical protein